MSYIGRQLNNLSDRVKLDSITASATATYNLLLNTVAYVPSSAESLTVSLNGVIQAPQSSYTVSGSQITFASALTSSDSIDFILAERSITLQTPSAGSVGTSQLAADAVNGDKIADDSISDEHLDITAITGQTEKTSLADADKFLISDSADSNALKYVQKSNLPSGGLQFINSVSSTSEVSNLTLDNVFTSTYTNYLIVGEYTLINGSGPQPRFQFRTGGSSGSDLSASEYNYHFLRMNADSTSVNNHMATGNTYCEFSDQTSNDSARVGIRLTWTVYNPFDNSVRTTVSGHGKITVQDGNSAFITGSCDYKGTNSVTGIKFYAHTDNVKNGEFRVYGIVDS